MSQELQRGKFIVYEGVGRVGKTTQIKLAHAYLESLGVSVDFTREPGGIPSAEHIRGLIFNWKAVGAINADHQMAMFMTARSFWIEQLVKPNILAGKNILSDRTYPSTAAFQGYGEGGDMEVIEQLSRLVMGDCMPDGIILLHCPWEVVKQRLENGNDGDPYDEESEAYFQRVINGYMEMAESNWSGVPWYVVDGTKSKEDVAADARKFLDTILKGEKVYV